MEKGLIEVYTGDGKGKTTAAIGLAIRALGAGKRVLLLQFMKNRSYSEHAVLQGLSQNLTVETGGKPFFVAKEGMLSEEARKAWGDEVVVFPPGQPPQEYAALIAALLQRGVEAAESAAYDLVILDELNVALFFGLVSREAAEELLRRRHQGTELVFTGRNAPQWLLARADLVTEMREIKHYYRQGVQARRGFEN